MSFYLLNRSPKDDSRRAETLRALVFLKKAPYLLKSVHKKLPYNQAEALNYKISALENYFKGINLCPSCLGEEDCQYCKGRVVLFLEGINYQDEEQIKEVFSGVHLVLFELALLLESEKMVPHLSPLTRALKRADKIAYTL